MTPRPDIITRMAGDQLPGMEDKDDARTSSRAVYAGVCTQIRELFANRTTDPAVEARYNALAGIIAQARSMAASIDRVSGVPGTRQASGQQLAMMHDQLAQLLDRLQPTAPAEDPFTALVAKLTATPAPDVVPDDA